MRSSGLPIGTIWILTCAPLLAAGEAVPTAVSPGEQSELVVIESRCPTFSWGEVPGAKRYELVVYELSGDPLGVAAPPGGEPAVRVTVAGGGQSWTPARDRCLARGKRYAWAVRAAPGPPDHDAWSEPLLFEVSALPTAAELRRALAILAAHRSPESGSTETPGEAARIADVQGGRGLGPSSSAPPRDSRARTAEGPEGLAVTPADATGVRVEADPTTGVVFGAHGVSASSGAGSAGAVGQSTSPSGATSGVIGQVSSAAGTAGVFDNTAGGPILSGLFNGLEVLALDGTGTLSATAFTGVGSGLTGVDAATLGGSAAAALTPTSHLHDDRYFTETELATSGGGGSVHWTNLGSVPAGIVDGADDDTTYTAGTGIVLDGTRFRLASWAGAPADTGTATLDTSSTDPGPGWQHSLAIGSDGLGLIGYYDKPITGPRTLGVAHCDDIPCSAATVTTLDSSATTAVGWTPETAIGGDGLGLISYHDRTAGYLKVAHCDNLECTSATVTTLDDTARVGIDSWLTIGTDGRGLISYYDETNAAIKMAHCSNDACTSATISTLDSAATFWSVTIGTDGRALVAYKDPTKATLKVAHCGNAACSSSTITSVDSPGGVAVGSLAIGSDGLGLIAYNDIASSLKVAHCDDSSCTTSTVTTLDTGVGGGVMTIGSDGLGLIAYRDNTATSLEVAHCSNVDCTGATITTLDSTGNLFPRAVRIGADGLGLITYYDSTSGDIRLAHCRDRVCTGAQTRVLGNGNTFGTPVDMTVGSDGFALVSYLDRNDNSLKVAHCGNALCLPFFRRR